MHDMNLLDLMKLMSNLVYYYSTNAPFLLKKVFIMFDSAMLDNATCTVHTCKSLQSNTQPN